VVNGESLVVFIKKKNFNHKHSTMFLQLATPGAITGSWRKNNKNVQNT